MCLPSFSCHCFVLILFLQIAKAVHEEVVSRDMVPTFVRLLKDTEAEVRTAIAGQLPGTFFFFFFQRCVYMRM